MCTMDYRYVESVSKGSQGNATARMGGIGSSSTTRGPGEPIETQDTGVGECHGALLVVDTRWANATYDSFTAARKQIQQLGLRRLKRTLTTPGPGGASETLDSAWGMSQKIRKYRYMIG